MRRLRTVAVALLLATAALEAQSQRTAVVFGNGVFSGPADATRGAMHLVTKFQDSLGNPSPDEIASEFSFHVAYNETGCPLDPGQSQQVGTSCILDILEAAQQLAELGQLEIDVGDFLRFLYRKEGVSGLVLATLSELFEERLLAYELDPQTIQDLIDHILLYRRLIEESPNLPESGRRRVVLVAHSQGNLFGLQSHQALTSFYQRSFGMVSVATPAAAKTNPGSHITLENDFIRRVPGALSPTIDISECGTESECHAFVDSYLELEGTRNEIMADILEVRDSLGFAPSIELVEPDGINGLADQEFEVSWIDSDPDSNASIHLFFSETSDCSSPSLIEADLSENLDDSFVWDTSEVAEGVYYVLATISDGQDPVGRACSAHSVIVDHTNPPDLQPRRLIAVTDSSDLVELDRLTGEQVRVIGATGRDLSSIAFDRRSGALYGVDGTQTLVAISLENGSTSPVGGGVDLASPGFAVDEVSGLTFGRRGELWGVATSLLGSSHLVSVDLVSGEGTLVGPVIGSRLSSLTYDPDQDQAFATSTTGGGQIFTVDLDTFEFAQVGGLGSGPRGIVHLADVPDTGLLFAIQSTSVLPNATTLGFLDTQTLFFNELAVLGTQGAVAGIEMVRFEGDASSPPQLVPDTAVVVEPSTDTLVVYDLETGDRGATIGLLGLDSIGALAFDRETGLLYGVASAENRLVTVDLSDGHTEFVGQEFGLQSQDSFITGVTGLTFGPGNVLYGVAIANQAARSWLIHIDTQTGLAEIIGGALPSAISGFAYDEDSGRAFISRTFGFGQIYEIDLSTAAISVPGQDGVFGPIGVAHLADLPGSFQLLAASTFPLASSGLKLGSLDPDTHGFSRFQLVGPPGGIAGLEMVKLPESSPIPALFADDFNDNEIDGESWETTGNRVVEVNGEFHVDSTVVDQSGRAATQPFHIDPTRPVEISRKAKVWHNGFNYTGAMLINIDGHPEKTFGIDYSRYTFNVLPSCPAHGFVIFRNSANSHQCTGSDQGVNTSEFLTPIWNQWFDERVVYGPVSGILDYYLNDLFQTSYNVGAWPDDTDIMWLRFSPWGWGTGHFQHMDDLVVRQPAPTSAPNTESLRLKRDATQYASTSASPPGFNFGSGGFTIESWIRTDAAGTLYTALVDKGRDNFGAWSLNIDEAPGKVTFKVRVGGVNRSVISASSYPVGAWFHVSARYDGASLKISLNGIENGSVPVSGLPGSNTVPVTVGRANDGALISFDGRIDEIRIWSRALTEDEILASYTRTLTGTESGLVAYWPLDSDYQDRTGNENHLVPQNGPVFAVEVPFN